jgi:hypothetical protein
MSKPTFKQVVWGTIGVVVVLLSLFGSIWAIDDHYTPREIHELTIADVYQSIRNLQLNNTLQREQDNVIYWQRIELQLENACDSHPNDAALRRKYNRARHERQQAEQRLREAQRKSREAQ